VIVEQRELQFENSNRSFPSFVSAATFLDVANTPRELTDFFGVQTANPTVTRVRCPILAFFGTRESDVGTEADLQLLKSSIERQSSGPRRVYRFPRLSKAIEFAQMAQYPPFKTIASEPRYQAVMRVIGLQR
jgi:hypothetical protein